MNKTGMNLVFSSWPSAGGTTLALMCALIFRQKYIYAGGAMKRWAELMGYDPKTSRLHDWEKKYGEAWDYLWESYIQFKVQNHENLLVEGKTAGFLLPEDRAFETMVIADDGERAKRAGLDSRKEDIVARDRLLQNRWLALFDIDLMDKAAISENYDLILDNTKLTIAQSIIAVAQKIIEFYDLDNIEGQAITDIEKVAHEFEQQYWRNQEIEGDGKKKLRQALESQDLYFNNVEIFRDWLTVFNEKFTKVPEEMRIAIEKEVKT